MADETDNGASVKIFPPDKTLLAKIGPENLGEIFSARKTDAVQAEIAKTAGEATEEMLARVGEMDRLFQEAANATAGETGLLAPLIAVAFEIKSDSGFAGYDLISALAKSLYLYCESQDKVAFTAKTREVIEWHITSIRQMLKLNIKGSGGAIGETILKELERLAALRG